MPSTSHKRFRRRRYQQTQAEPETPRPQKKRPDRGLFSDGQWWCNCEPRKKMNLLETKKEGPNKGKFFYKCFDCNFFLWWDQARARETGLEASSKDKPADADIAEPPLPKTPSLTQKQLTSYGYTSERRASDTESGEDSGDADAGDPAPVTTTTATGMETPCPSTSKRKRDVFEEDEFSDFGSEEERELIEVADRSAEKMKSQKETFATPSNPRSTDIVSGLPTPSVARTLFPEAKRHKQVSFEEVPPSTLSTPGTLGRSTPATTPSRSVSSATSNRQSMPPSSSPPNDGYDVTAEVMGILQSQALDHKVLSEVRTLLETSARRAKGIALGRESAQAAVKMRDEKIAQLQERVVTLENRDKMHRNQVTNIKANLMKMYEDN